MVYGNQFLILEAAEDGKVIARYQVPIKPFDDDLPEETEGRKIPMPRVRPYAGIWRTEERLTVCANLDEIKMAVEKAKKNWDAIQLLKDDGKLSL